ncbi:type II toxin-antitoxin system PemK/MazF family toxin, partial [Vibrio cholerae]|nr:type II toxin-antitoxin system PemK/MazF family toxin [Vibrio cholerae]
TVPTGRESARLGRPPSPPSSGRTPGQATEDPPSRPPTADRRRKAALAYSPSSDGRPDPGEIVWTWVPYEDDPTRGKDRPVLLVGRDGARLLGLMMTSRDRNNARDHDSRYVDIGTGAWDRQGRPSEVRVDRLLTIDPADIRREGAVLPRSRFEQVVEALPDHLLG